MARGGRGAGRLDRAILAHGALPILFPSLLGTFALLFANSFGAVATAYALTGSSLSIVPIMLFAQIRGDVLQDPHLAMPWPSA